MGLRDSDHDVLRILAIHNLETQMTPFKCVLNLYLSNGIQLCSPYLSTPQSRKTIPAFVISTTATQLHIHVSKPPSKNQYMF